MMLMTLTISCEKERTETEDPQTEYTSLDEFYDENQPEEQSFIIDSLGGDTIIGKEGTHIWGIPKTIFMNKATQQDIFYPYELRLIESYSIKNMILSKLPTVAQGNLLISEGEVKVTAYKNGQELAIKQHMGYEMMTPSANPLANMELFYGFTAGTTNDWTKFLLLTDYLFPTDGVTHISNSSEGYMLKVAKTGWVNVAKEFTYTPKTDITFTAAGVNTNFIDIYAIFPGQRSFIKVSDMSLTNMPLGETMKVFSMGKDKEGKMHYFLQTYTITSNLLVDVVMQEATKAEVLAAMDTL